MLRRTPGRDGVRRSRPMPASRFMVGASSTGNVLLTSSMVVYIHACTYVALDESLNRAATSPPANPG
jgi:hypothetical protein